MTQTHPDPARIDDAIQAIAVAAMRLNRPCLDMEAGAIYHRRLETRADFIGWWQLATQADLDDLITDSDSILLDSHGGPYRFHPGADDFADFVGLQDHRQLEDWAHANPILWGNPNGAWLFQDLAAYDALPMAAPTEFEYLQQVVRHWLAVAQRLRAFHTDPRKQAAWAANG